MKYIGSVKAKLLEQGVDEAIINEALKEMPKDTVNLTQDELTKMMDDVAQKVLEKSGINEISNKLEALKDEKVNQGTVHGFKSLSDFCLAVKKDRSGVKDERLYKEINGKTLTTIDPGEFIIPEEYATQIMATVLADDGLFGRMTNFPVMGNSLKIPYWVDKNHTDGNLFGGMQVYYEEEAPSVAVTESKFKVGQLKLDLHKLIGYTTTSNELLEDSPFAMDILLRDKFGEVINYKLNDASINGTGAGQILGILNADALIETPKEAAQTDIIVTKNLFNMYARMYKPSLSKSMWMISNTLVPELQDLSIGNTPIWLPNNNIAGSPFGTILGRPVMISEFCKSAGKKGDIFLIDWSQYVSITKQGSTPNFASSIHLLFDVDKTAYKIVFRHDAQPWWDTYITPKEAGDFTTSPFITLEARI